MEIPGLGAVKKDAEFSWYYSEPLPLSLLGGKRCRIFVDNYDEDPNKDEIHAAIANFLALRPSVLTQAEKHIFRYYQDCNDIWESEDEEFLAIESPADVWGYIHLGDSPHVTRRAYGDRGIYIVLECECDWEEEHGLMIVFKNGLRVNKISGFDGHVTNSDAYANSKLEDVIYQSP